MAEGDTIKKHFSDEAFCEAIQEIIDQKVGQYMGRLKSSKMTDFDLRVANGAVIALTELKSEFETIRTQAIEERS